MVISIIYKDLHIQIRQYFLSVLTCAWCAVRFLGQPCVVAEVSRWTGNDIISCSLWTVVALGARVSCVAMDTLSSGRAHIAGARPRVVDVGSVGAWDRGD